MTTAADTAVLHVAAPETSHVPKVERAPQPPPRRRRLLPWVLLVCAGAGAVYVWKVGIAAPAKTPEPTAASQEESKHTVFADGVLTLTPAQQEAIGVAVETV